VKNEKVLEKKQANIKEKDAKRGQITPQAGS
jgi:hypothetical protein